MLDIIYRFDPTQPGKLKEPATAAEAQALLEKGNRHFADLLAPAMDPGEHESLVVPLTLADFGAGVDGALLQRPFASVLGCSDARAPVEMIFDQTFNALFVVRVAGNVMGSECVGSLDYAVNSFAKVMRLLVVLGHTGCGAVSAAVDAFLTPATYLPLSARPALRLILDRLMIAVRTSAMALEAEYGAGVAANPGYRQALIETSITVNAALSAYTLKQDFGHADSQGPEVVYGIYDLMTRRVGVPLSDPLSEVVLKRPPADVREFRQLGNQLARGARVFLS